MCWRHLQSIERVARKEHKCFLCGKVIEKKSRHFVVSGVWDNDRIISSKRHVACDNAAYDYDFESHTEEGFNDKLR